MKKITSILVLFTLITSLFTLGGANFSASAASPPLYTITENWASSGDINGVVLPNGNFTTEKSHTADTSVKIFFDSAEAPYVMKMKADGVTDDKITPVSLEKYYYKSVKQYEYIENGETFFGSEVVAQGFVNTAEEAPVYTDGTMCTLYARYSIVLDTTGIYKAYTGSGAAFTFKITAGTPTYNATPNKSKIVVNGTEVTVEAYTINQNNYIKLRDIAMILRGTTKEYEVEWRTGEDAIYVHPNTKYTPEDTDLIFNTPGDKEATLNPAPVYIGTSRADLLAYGIVQPNNHKSNYFKLRDVARALGFDVSFVPSQGDLISIETDKPYTDD